MRQVGKRKPREPALQPSGEFLLSARAHQRGARALAAVQTTGILKGLYRFRTHEEMNRHDDEALARAMGINIRRRTRESSGE